MGIKDWYESERPREKLLNMGAQSLSDGELLAILIRNGVRGVSAVDLGNILLETFGGLQGLYKASDKEILSIKGMGIAKLAPIKSSIEVTRRYIEEKTKKSPQLTNMDGVFELLQCSIVDWDREEFWGVFLNHQGMLIKTLMFSYGSFGIVGVSVRETLKQVIQYNTAKVIFAHNHPSNNISPSEEDITVTKKLLDACKTLEIELLDHMVISRNTYFSIVNSGLLG